MTPARSSGSARLIAVWPPNCTTTPDACSSRMIAVTASSSSGSKYRRVLQSKSVLTVSGLLLTMTASTPWRAERHRSVDAAVVELDALADANRTAAEHDDRVRRRRRCGRPLVLGLVRRVVVRRRRLELGGARVDAFEDRMHTAARSAVARTALRRDTGERADARVGETGALRGASASSSSPFQRSRSSQATIVPRRRRNHAEIPLRRVNSSGVAPPRSASSRRSRAPVVGDIDEHRFVQHARDLVAAARASAAPC